MATDYEQILTFAVSLGEVMLRSGAETYRVEDTISRILSVHNFEQVDTFVTPTGITTSISGHNMPICTLLRRVKHRSNRLDKIEYLNQLSRDYVMGKLTLEQATIKVHEIDNIAPYSPNTIILITGFSAGSFSLMFHGGVVEFFVSFVIGFFSAVVHKFLADRGVINYLALFLVSFTIGSSVMVLHNIVADVINVDSITTGCVMTLVPGVIFTNAIRDTIGEELLSGISRAVEALTIAIVIAVGICIPMFLGLQVGGGL
ncbi:MAG: hypothetical protein ATN36_02325 [Epulopiscium sp. Nele67-Bin005]|nr:MAG: hypothetical protein ATN36_02325 [Epulopiscium sp. Nele67-Bin005]